VTLLLPEGMTKPAPEGQFTVWPVPLALSVPLTPVVTRVEQAALPQATTVTVLGVQVSPVPEAWRSSRWCRVLQSGGLGEAEMQVLVQVPTAPQQAPAVTVLECRVMV